MPQCCDRDRALPWVLLVLSGAAGCRVVSCGCAGAAVGCCAVVRCCTSLASSLCQDRRRAQERGGSSWRAAPVVGSSPRESCSQAESRDRRAACSRTPASAPAAVSPPGASYRLDRPL